MKPQEYLTKCLKALLKDEEKYIGLKFALKQGGKYGFLSPQKLGCFAGNPTELREYIESFWINVYSKVTFIANIGMSH